MWDLLIFVVVVALLIYGYMWFQRKSNAAFSQSSSTAKAVVTDATRHKLEDEMKKKSEAMDHEMVILYATQTGTAQTFCKTLFKEAERYAARSPPPPPFFLFP